MSKVILGLPAHTHIHTRTRARKPTIFDGILFLPHALLIHKWKQSYSNGQFGRCLPENPGRDFVLSALLHTYRAAHILYRLYISMTCHQLSAVTLSTASDIERGDDPVSFSQEIRNPIDWSRNRRGFFSHMSK